MNPLRSVPALLAALALTASQGSAADPPAPAAPPAGLESILTEWTAHGGNLAKILGDLPDSGVHSPAEAAAVVRAIKKAAATDDPAALGWLAGLFLEVKSRPAHALLNKNGIPALRAWASKFPVREPGRDSAAGPWLAVVRVLAGYRDPVATDLTVSAARAALAPDDEAWDSLLGEFDADHPESGKLFARLTEPLPPGRIGALFLNAVNQVMLKKPLKQHPFDSEAGAARMKEWLTATASGQFIHAYSSAVAIAFVKGKRHDELFALARKHPDPDIRLEAAWADVKSGGTAGIDDLAAAAKDPNLSGLACEYLQELGLKDKIPAEATDKTFAAKAEMIRWLRHPNELGAPPATIELFDTRELVWPPAGEKRQVWLFKFTWRFKESEPFETGYGMTGTMTWAFFNPEEGKPSPTAEDLYARHCALELVRKENRKETDPEVSPAKARALLQKQNPGSKF